MSGITIRQLEIFAQVVEHGGFRRCADQLGVSQVSISEHVRELENRLGIRLFDRRAGGPATLTQEGLRAHRRIVSILTDLNDLIRDVGAAPYGDRRQLAVAMHPFLLRYLRDALAEFRSLHPNIEVRLDLDPATPETLYERVMDRELDAAYIFAFDGREVPVSELVRLEPLAIFVGSTHALASKKPVTIADIRATPAIHLTPRNPLRPLVDRALAQVGANGSPVGLDTDEYGLILTSVRRNDGFSCMFPSPETEASQNSGIVSVPLEFPIPALQVRRIIRRSLGHDPPASDLIERLTKTMKEA